MIICLTRMIFKNAVFVNKTKNYILIIGSKPESKLPDLNVETFYTANGAAERASEYKKKYPKTNFISIVSGFEFIKNIEVQNRVVEAKPSFLISRSDKIELSKYNFSKSMRFLYFSNLNQYLFQCHFFKLGIWDLLISEFKYEETIRNKLILFAKTIKYLRFSGVSTGFFAILYALKKHPNSKVIITGIGMKGGGHFYNSDTKYSINRSNVDRALMKNIKKKYKERLFTIDSELARLTGIKFIDVKTF